MPKYDDFDLDLQNSVSLSTPPGYTEPATVTCYPYNSCFTTSNPDNTCQTCHTCIQYRTNCADGLA